MFYKVSVIRTNLVNMATSTLDCEVEVAASESQDAAVRAAILHLTSPRVSAGFRYEIEVHEIPRHGAMPVRVTGVENMDMAFRERTNRELNRMARELEIFRQALGGLVVLHEAGKDLNRDRTLAQLAQDYNGG